MSTATRYDRARSINVFSGHFGGRFSRPKDLDCRSFSELQEEYEGRAIQKQIC